jgi:hypothetical protein
MKAIEPLYLLQLGLEVFKYGLTFISAFCRSRASLGCELLALRSQLAFYRHNIQQRKELRPSFTPAFRLLWVLLSKLWSGWRSAAQLMQPETIVKWHQRAFRRWWRWKSGRRGGRPSISKQMQAVIRRLSRENVLWSAERIHGHLLLLGLDPPCPDTIRKYMVQPTRKGKKSQSWLTFLRNYKTVSWGMDFFTVPTLRFEILYVFVILSHSCRQILHLALTGRCWIRSCFAEPSQAHVIQRLHLGLIPSLIER